MIKNFILKTGKHLNEGRVFVCRFAMKPCFVIASNHLVKELLEEKSGHAIETSLDLQACVVQGKWRS